MFDNTIECANTTEYDVSKYVNYDPFGFPYIHFLLSSSAVDQRENFLHCWFKTNSHDFKITLSSELAVLT